MQKELDFLSTVKKNFKESWYERFEEFVTKTAYDVCVPRNQIISVPKDISLEKALQKVASDLFSSYPVHDQENQDEIVGVLLVKDLLKNMSSLKTKKVESVMHPVRFIAYSESVVSVFETFQKEKLNLAIIINQYGEMDGMVTVGDILEELVGEIPDTRVDKVRVLKKHKGQLIFDGRFPLEELNKTYKTNFEEGDIETLGGYLSFKLGRLPEVGEKIKLGEMNFVILQKNARIITKLSIEGLEAK